MLVGTTDTVFWLVNNIRYVIAAGFILSIIIFTLASWYILTRFIPFPSITWINPFCWYRYKNESGSGRLKRTTVRRSPSTMTAGTGTRKSTVKKESSGSTASGRSSPAPRRTRSTTSSMNKSKKLASSVVSDGLGILRTALTASLSIALVGSICICAFSLTASGCNVLRQLGLLEWLPWRKGLKCYRTKWDWVAEIFGELVLTVLRHHDSPPAYGAGAGAGAGLGSSLGYGMGISGK
ncbi:hypothetical protein IAT40_006484 [Kwoniella sp. CBS 6097]